MSLLNHKKSINLVLSISACMLSTSCARMTDMKGFEKPVVLNAEKMSYFRSQSNNPELASPVLYNDRVVIASSRKTVAVFDLRGRLQYRFPLEFKPVSTPAIQDEKLLVGGSDGRFHCLLLDSGDEVWSFDFKTIGFSEPEVAENNVIFQTANDRVAALFIDNGNWAWEHQHIRPRDLAIKGLCPPRSFNDKVFIGLSGGYVACFMRKSGKLLWKSRIFKDEQFMDVDAPIELDQEKAYVVSAGGEVAALSQATGRVIWRYQSGGLEGARLDQDMIYLATDEAKLIALDKDTGGEAWTTRLSTSKKVDYLQAPTRPIVLEDMVVTTSRGGKVMVVDKGSGEVLDSWNSLVMVSGPIVPLRDNGFLIMDNKGMARLWELE